MEIFLPEVVEQLINENVRRTVEAMQLCNQLFDVIGWCLRQFPCLLIFSFGKVARVVSGLRGQFVFGAVIVVYRCNQLIIGIFM